jgi:trimeric autotransporter adhesin
MPSTYTTNGGIELPANGEQSGTWGETINDNMSIIDRLTNGVGSISLSGTTHTLTTTDGTLSDGQYNVLVLGGSPSGTNTITISPNDGEHVYIVKNISGQTATFTQGSGASISVLNNTTKIIYADGAGAGAAVVDITGALDLGSLIIAGTSVTATAAELNFVDGVTSNVQTQLNTKAPLASPTFTGTATVTGNLTVDGGTIKLDGNYPVGTNNVALGDAALDSVEAGGSYNVAIGDSAGTAITTGDHNVAIGFNALDAEDGGTASVAIGSYALSSQNADGNNFNTAVGYVAGSDITTGIQNTLIGALAGDALIAAADNVAVGFEALSTETGGQNNVAIGPRALKVQVNASGNIYNTAVGSNAATATTTGNLNTAIGGNALYSNTTASNNTAVGYQAGYANTTGIQNLFVGSDAGYANTTGSGNTYVGRGDSVAAGVLMTTGSKNTILGGFTGNSGGLDIRTANNHVVLSDGDGNLRGVFDASGNLLVGTTSNIVNDNARVAIVGVEGLRAQATSGGGSSCIGAFATSSGGTYYYVGYDLTASAIKYQVLFNGNVQNTNNSYGAISDAKLKENVTDATPKLEKLNQVRVVNFNLIGDEQKQIGVIAQELEQIFPSIVEDTPDCDAEGNDLGTVTKSVKYSVFVPMLIKAIQEQQTIIEALTARIETLEGK